MKQGLVLVTGATGSGKSTTLASFINETRRALRKDPDIVLIDEMRDLETIRAALTIAETGHLTFGTLHTGTAVHTITRIISAFPANEQELVRTQLSGSLRHVICQQLLPTADQSGRCLAAEIMVATPAVRALIRENRIHQIPSEMQTGGRLGMVAFNHSVEQLLHCGRIAPEAAEEYRIKDD